MLGQLACSGVGRAMSHEDAKDTEQLWNSCARSNEALLGQLREASVADRACLRGHLPALTGHCECWHSDVLAQRFSN